MHFIARKNETGNEQSLKEHLENVSQLSKKFASKFNSESIGCTIGLLHDVGKYSLAFQRRINGSAEQVDHSTAGLQLSLKEYNHKNPAGRIMGYCIAGHHAGLPNFGSKIDYQNEPTLMGRSKKEIEDYSYYSQEINLMKTIELSPLQDILKKSKLYDFSLSVYTRMLFSCLVDADYLDTESFMNPSQNRKIDYDFDTFLNKLNDHMAKLNLRPGVINKYRRDIQQKCIEASNGERGIYRMTVPTGGGKTLSSIAFALRHLKIHNLDRIIYVIPYTSIIDQTAIELKRLFGENYVLEHHYNFTFEDNEFEYTDSAKEKMKLATENWDYPIVVTTNVQFFESLFSNTSSRCRKLHNISKSIIIFDEVQMLPYDFLKPCLLVIQELVNNYNASILMCSATQPNFNQVVEDFQVKDIIENPIALYDIFKRTTVIYIGSKSDEDLIENVSQNKQVLTIVNTRKKSKSLFDLSRNKDAYCLTTLLTPRDRKNAIKEIKHKLVNNENCVVFSTQLIEAGVDIDFPIVYREIAGIDSIVQASGRCNRERKQENGNVYVFTSEDYKFTSSSHIDLGMAIGKVILDKYEDFISIKAVEEYFSEVHQRTNTDIQNIIKCFQKEGLLGIQYDFKAAAERFKLIVSTQWPIIIPNDDNKQLLNELIHTESPKGILRKLQQHTVMVYEYEMNKLKKDNKIKELIPGFFILTDFELYNIKTGLNIFYDSIYKDYIY